MRRRFRRADQGDVKSKVPFVIADRIGRQGTATLTARVDEPIVQLVLEVKDGVRTGARQMGWATSLAGLLGIGFDELGDLLLAAIPLIVWMAVGIWGFRNGIFWKP